jgi:hypothetical protein
MAIGFKANALRVYFQANHYLPLLHNFLEERAGERRLPLP